MKVFKGREDAPIVFVGEFHGPEENARGIPFIGESGMELGRMVAEAGFFNDDCCYTNVVCDVPPGGKMPSFFKTKGEGKKERLTPFMGFYANEAVINGVKELEEFLALHPRKLIIGLGNMALWAMTGITGGAKDWCPGGITRWRSSIMSSRLGYKFIPLYNPANVLYNRSELWIMVQDLRRCRNESEFREIHIPKWKFLIQPSFSEAMKWIDSIKAGDILVSDIETSRRQISCIGFAKSALDAICIPFITQRNNGDNEGYWSRDEEIAITLAIKKLLTRTDIKIVFHNSSFDCHYIAYQWGYIPNYTDDTILLQHVIYPGLPKSLSFCSSLYADYHLYWKEDNKEREKRVSDDQHWTYNCTDCVRTYDIFETLISIKDKYGLQEQYQYLIDLIEPVLEMEMRGLKVDTERRQKVGQELLLSMAKREEFFRIVLGHNLNPRSHTQMKTLFYEDFKEKKIYHRKTREVTLDDDALQTILKRSPLLRPLIEAIEEYRSLGVFHSNYIKSKISNDGRMRPGINMVGTETYRFSMHKDMFGEGTNMQTIPSGTED